MKLSTKIILPIILISALLILLSGCFGVPADEEPGVTEVGTGTITGIIAAPCCDTSGEPISETSGSSEYWCYWCEKDWYLQADVADVEVILTSGQVEIDTTTTNDKGEYTFTSIVYVAIPSGASSQSVSQLITPTAVILIPVGGVNPVFQAKTRGPPF
ncbi:unnamed protein product, partial [marine sediment metagenome]